MRVGGIGNDPVIDDSSPTTSSDDTSSRIRDRISRRRDDDPATSGVGSTEEERERSSGGSSSAQDRRRIREATTIDTSVGLTPSAAAAAGSADDFGDFDSPGPGGAGGQGTATVEPADESDVIDRAADAFTQRVAEPFGDLVADATPVTAIEEATTGTQRSRDFFQSAGSGAAQVVNIPGYVAGARTGLQAQSETQQTVGVGPFVATGGIPDPDGQAEQAGRAAEAASAAASAAADNPFSAAGTATGAVAGGLGVAGAATRASRATTSSTFGSGRSTFDFDDFVSADRAQSQIGRQRRSSDSDTRITADDIEPRQVDPDQTSVRPEFEPTADIDPGSALARRRSQLIRGDRVADDRGVDIAFERTMERDFGFGTSTDATTPTTPGGVSGAQGAGLGTIAPVNDPTGIADTRGLTPEAESAAGTAADYGDLDAADVGTLSQVNDPTGIADIDTPVGTGTGVGDITGTEVDSGTGTATDSVTRPSTRETTAQTTRIGARTAVGTQTVQATTTTQDEQLTQLSELTAVDAAFTEGARLNTGRPPRGRRRIPIPGLEMDEEVADDIDDLGFDTEFEDVEFETQSLDAVDRDLEGMFDAP